MMFLALTYSRNLVTNVVVFLWLRLQYKFIYIDLSKEDIINLIFKTISEREGKFTGLAIEEIINLLLKTISEKKQWRWWC